ncbi:hypothetical protein [Halapricum desulfuricans]|nr:hypothetical protein [Halapricum desulfuricans]
MAQTDTGSGSLAIEAALLAVAVLLPVASYRRAVRRFDRYTPS